MWRERATTFKAPLTEASGKTRKQAEVDKQQRGMNSKFNGAARNKAAVTRAMKNNVNLQSPFCMKVENTN